MSLEKHGAGGEQALRMLDLFAGLEVATFDLTRTDIDGHKQSFRPAQSLDALRRRIPSLLSSAIQCRQNLIVRPKQAPAALVQLDDLGGAMLGRVRSVAFLILMTSIGNHQAWVAVRECGPDFARRLRLGSGADSSASGAARVAGSVNFKRKYAPDFPTVQILEATPHRTVTPGELEALGLVAAPESRPAIRANWIFPDRRSKAWPSYERCLQNAPPARDRGRPDVSRADFTFCLLAIDWGWSLAETAERLLEKSSKARENGEGYARLTTQHAAAAVDRRQRRFDGSGPALGRSRLPDFEKAGSYPHPQPKAKAPGPSAGCEHSFVDARVSAEPAIALGG